MSPLVQGEAEVLRGHGSKSDCGGADTRLGPDCPTHSEARVHLSQVVSWEDAGRWVTQRGCWGQGEGSSQQPPGKFLSSLLPRPGLQPPVVLGKWVLGKWVLGEWVLGRSHGSCHLMPREHPAASRGRGTLSARQPLSPVRPQTPLYSRQSPCLRSEHL